MLHDARGRTMNYLRLSVTDRCSLRCRYCMPKGRPADDELRGRILTFEELSRIASILAKMGIRKVRLTGGEPLSRRGISHLVGLLAATPGVDAVAMTTNGQGIKEHAADLKRRGLASVNIHIDSLEPLTYRWITGSESLREATAGIEAALAADFDEVKLNAVLMRGINDDEVDDLLSFAENLGVPIRFIELMPMAAAAFYKKHFISMDEIMARFDHPLVPMPHSPMGRGEGEGAKGKIKGPAKYYRMGGAIVGFIGHRSNKFCGSCNRLRLLADGTLKGCIASSRDLSLGALIDLSDEELLEIIERYVAAKPADHANFARAGCDAHARMCAIGG